MSVCQYVYMYRVNHETTSTILKIRPLMDNYIIYVRHKLLLKRLNMIIYTNNAIEVECKSKSKVKVVFRIVHMRPRIAHDR